MNKTAFAAKLKSGRTIVIDGGMSNELEALGLNLNNSLWSASALLENQDTIKQAHLNYLNAGANVVITSSYQTSVRGFAAIGISEKQANKMTTRTVDIAKKAIKEFLLHKPTGTAKPLIAASIGPYGASMADGSEYTGDYGLTDEELADFHRDRLLLLDQTDADVLACETVPSLQEATILHDILLDSKTPAWVTFSCKDGKLANDGTPIEECAKLYKDHPNVLGIGINCTALQYAVELIERIKKTVPHKAIVAYPNSGEHYHADTKTWSGTSSPISCGLAAQKWMKAGASIIGGCCRMGPDHIKEIKHKCT
jgi:homocysteine S-methyltransferase